MHPLDLLFPRRSLTGEHGTWITSEELQKLRSDPVEEEATHLRHIGLHALDAIRAAGTYRKCPLLRRAIHLLKYRRVPALRTTLGNLLVSAPFVRTIPQAVICPVPLHWSRKFWRGFNQAELLAHAVGLACKMPVQELLCRTHATGHQAHRNRVDRFMAMQSAFHCVTCDIPSQVILIDDVATTGATLDACAAELKSHGVRRVEAWVLARD